MTEEQIGLWLKQMHDGMALAKLDDVAANFKATFDMITRQKEEIDRLRAVLESIAEYWNGSCTDGAMKNALDVIISRAEAALEAKP